MKVKAYVRVGRNSKGKPTMSATMKHTVEPLKDSYGDAIPTVGFAVEFEVSDAALNRSSQLLARVAIDNPEPLATVTQIEATS